MTTVYTTMWVPTYDVVFRKGKKYIGMRNGQVEIVTCVQGAKADNVKRPAIFKSSHSSCFMFEFKVFDWLMDMPA